MLRPTHASTSTQSSQSYRNEASQQEFNLKAFAEQTWPLAAVERLRPQKDLETTARYAGAERTTSFVACASSLEAASKAWKEQLAEAAILQGRRPTDEEWNHCLGEAIGTLGEMLLKEHTPMNPCETLAVISTDNFTEVNRLQKSADSVEPQNLVRFTNLVKGLQAVAASTEAIHSATRQNFLATRARGILVPVPAAPREAKLLLSATPLLANAMLNRGNRSNESETVRKARTELNTSIAQDQFNISEHLKHIANLAEACQSTMPARPTTGSLVDELKSATGFSKRFDILAAAWSETGVEADLLSLPREYCKEGKFDQAYDRLKKDRSTLGKLAQMFTYRDKVRPFLPLLDVMLDHLKQAKTGQSSHTQSERS